MQMLDELLGIVCDDLCCKDGDNCPIDSHTTKLMNFIEQEGKEWVEQKHGN